MMKRNLLIMISLFVVIGCLTVVSVSACVPEWIADKGYLYAEKFFENWSEEKVSELTEDDERLEYQELYYHHDENDEIDWVLVKGQRSFTHYEDGEVISRFGPYFIANGRWEYTFRGGLGVYDVKQNKFVDVTNDCYLRQTMSEDSIVDYRDYEGFIEALESVEWPNGYQYLYLAGDLDGDNELTILDATVLQRWLAELEYPTKAKLDRNILGDFDDDGNITIMDATAIQRYLVGLNE